MKNVAEVLERLAAKQFDALLGVYECAWLDAKESPYVLDGLKQKLEFAKDVSALANSIGGLIVLGFDTARDVLTAAERINEVKPFPLHMVNSDRCRKVIEEYVHPPPDTEITLYEAADGKGLATIVVHEGLSKPYIVSKMMDESGRTIGAHFGYFERKQDVIPSITVERIQQLLAAGQQWGSIDQRLQAIEATMNAWSKPGPAKRKDFLVTEPERVSRLKAARLAVARDDAPLVYYMVTPEGECDFPTLLRSRGERVVRLIERPPQLRPQGFEIWAGDSSEILQGKMRRNVLSGSRIIELWKDGVFIFVAPGDEDFLGWRMHGFDKPIHISNFVLAESILMFCWLTKLIYEESDPKPPALRLTVGFDNLTRPSGPATLGSAPEGRMRFQGDVREAPGPKLEVYELAELADFDAERVAYLLLANIYNAFGFDAMNVPYINLSDPKPRIKAEAITGSDLPETVPTPDDY